jgi:protein TIF31
LDEQNKEFKLIGPSELKGILGSDGRFYVLDLSRTTPKDLNYKDVSTAIVRRELIRSYTKHQFTMDYFKTREEEYQKMIQEEMKKQSDSPKDSQEETKQDVQLEEAKQQVQVDTKQEVEKVEVKPEEVKSEDKTEEEPKSEEKKLFQFNVDVFTTSKVTGENVENDSKDVTELSDFLVEKVIPSLVSEFQNLEAMPLDGPSLTDVFHDRGINMRYLGKVATLCQSIPHIITLCEQEMFVRSLKQEFRSMLRKTSTDQLMTSILKFLNSIFGKNSENQKKKMIQIVKVVKDKFNYNLDKNFNFVKLPTLRSFCLRVGLKIVTKDYDYESKTPFNFESILGIEPTIKHSTPKSLNANGFLELGRQHLLIGQFESAYEILSQSMIMFQQVQGPMNKEVATCFSHLGTILLQSNDVVQSILNQHKALIICRRVMGVDSAIESNLYQLLGLLCHSFGQPEFALKHFLRAKYINELICGSDHPDTALILANIASMYQEMGDNHKCFAYMEKAIAMNERVLGIDHLQTATTYHSIALMYGMIQKPKIALDYEKKNYRILVNKFGIQDLRVMESSQWLEMFTGKAVKAQKEIKKETLATQLKKQKFMNQN